MIAMQYSFLLPADYDMGIIDRRVLEKGHVLDDHAPLVFKAYGVARKGDEESRSEVNLYAPFYLWNDTEGLSSFICGPGFAGLVASFGWPTVRSWPAVLASQVSPHARSASFGVREIENVRPYTPLDRLKEQEAETALDAARNGALVAVAAFEPTTWSLVRYTAWHDHPARMHSHSGGEVQQYRIRHISQPHGAR